MSPAFHPISPTEMEKGVCPWPLLQPRKGCRPVFRDGVHYLPGYRSKPPRAEAVPTLTPQGRVAPAMARHLPSRGLTPTGSKRTSSARQSGRRRHIGNSTGAAGLTHLVSFLYPPFHKHRLGSRTGCPIQREVSDVSSPSVLLSVSGPGSPDNSGLRQSHALVLTSEVVGASPVPL